MSNPRIILLGAGGHARSCIDVIEQQGLFRIHGLVGIAEEVGLDLLGYPVLVADEALDEIRAECQAALITVGQILTPATRMRLFGKAQSLGFQLPTIVSPKAHVSRHAKLGAGTIVMHGAVINAGASVGQNCIINSQSLVEHDTQVEAHCHVATGAIVNGACRIGEGTFIGSRSVIKEGLELGERCIIGMGLIVRKSQPSHTRIVKNI